MLPMFNNNFLLLKFGSKNYKLNILIWTNFEGFLSVEARKIIKKLHNFIVGFKFVVMIIKGSLKINEITFSLQLDLVNSS